MDKTPNYAIYQANYKEGKLVEVVILCLDPPAEPDWHLPMDHVTSVESVVEILKVGDTVTAVWDQVSIPVEVIQLPSGEESIEVVQWGQSERYQTLANLPCEEDIFEHTDCFTLQGVQHVKPDNFARFSN